MADVTQGSRGDKRESCGSSAIMVHGTKPSSSQSMNKIPGLNGTNNVVG